MTELYLGIDTSNYTTSAALFDGERVLENRKKLLPVKPGEKGLRQSDAVFHHVRQLLQRWGCPSHPLRRKTPICPAFWWESRLPTC